MKNTITITFIMVCACSMVYCQKKYVQVDAYDIYKSGWAMVKKSNTYGFIDTAGKEIVHPVYTSIAQFGVDIDRWAKVCKNGKYGFIDTTGKEVIKPVYDKIGEFGTIKKDWALVWKKGRAGAINKVGKEIIPTQYDRIGDYDEEKCQCAVVKIGKQQFIINSLGKQIQTTVNTKAFSQNKASIVNKILEILNTIVLTTTKMDWKFDGEMSIVKPFTIDSNKILSITVRYELDSSFYYVKMEAPFNKINEIELDVYFVLSFVDNEVSVFTSDKGSKNMIYRESINLFHIGEPFPVQEKLLDDLQRLYKNFEIFSDH